MNVELIKQFLSKKESLAALKDEAATIKKELDELEPQVVETLAEDGIDRITVDGKTVHTIRAVRGSAGGNMGRLISALKDAELEVLVTETVHGGRLSSWVREFEDGSAVPLSPEKISKRIAERHGFETASAINITETFTIGVKKS